MLLVLLTVTSSFIAVGFQSLTDYSSASSHEATIRNPLLIATNASLATPTFWIYVSSLDPLNMSLMADVPAANVTGYEFFLIGLPFQLLYPITPYHGEEANWSYSPAGSFLLNMSVRTERCSSHQTWFGSECPSGFGMFSLQSNVSALIGTRGEYSILLPFGYPPSDSVQTAVAGASIFLCFPLFCRTRTAIYRVDIVLPYSSTDVRIESSSFPYTLYPELESQNKVATIVSYEINHTTFDNWFWAPTVSLQYSVRSELVHYQGDLVWGPTWFVTGVGLTMSFGYEAISKALLRTDQRRD